MEAQILDDYEIISLFNVFFHVLTFGEHVCSTRACQSEYDGSYRENVVG